MDKQERLAENLCPGRGDRLLGGKVEKEEAEEIFEKVEPLMPVDVLSLSIIVPKPRIVERIQT